jgi:hypothetical protein
MTLSTIEFQPVDDPMIIKRRPPKKNLAGNVTTIA